MTSVEHTATTTMSEPVATGEQSRNNKEVTHSVFEVLDSDEEAGDSGVFDGGNTNEEDDEEDDEDDDDEDQDVVIRKRMDRVPRNRRRPAKFRDDEIWG
jgi:hypothetical protein